MSSFQKIFQTTNFVFFVFLFFFAFGLQAQTNDSKKKKVLLLDFLPYKTEKNAKLTSQISERSIQKLSEQNLEVTNESEKKLQDVLDSAKQQGYDFVVAGFYTKPDANSVTIYSQIYNPETSQIIDALSQSDTLENLEGLKLDESETKKTQEETINEFAKKLSIRLKTNTKKTERRENINEHLLSKELSKDLNFAIAKEDKAQASDDVFKLIQEKEQTVVSVSKFAQKTSEAPADVTVISREQIRRQGFRNLNEALQTVPQVYSHWVGQNWSADFRGLFVNNQIERRVLYLQDGKKLNDYFHFGDFYSDVFTDMERVEKIEVIKGPGAALYGNNSITGVVNVITRKPKTKNESELIAEYDTRLQKQTIRALYYSKFSDKFSVNFDVSGFEGKGSYDSGWNSWGNTQFFDPRTGVATGTSQYGRNSSTIITEQRYWGSTNSTVSNGKWMPNFNLDITYGDFNIRSFYMSKRTSWVPPQNDGGASGRETEYGSPINDRIWGVGMTSIDYTPKALEKYEFNFKIFRQININSDFREKGFTGFANNGFAPGGANANARLSSADYRNFMLFSGGGIIKAYASTALTNGAEYQVTPYKMESPKNFITSFRVMLGGNAAEVQYINYQRMESKNSDYPYLYNQGIANDGRQYGQWLQMSMSFNTNTTLIAGGRYDWQRINRVYRFEYGNPAYTAAEVLNFPGTTTPFNSTINQNANFQPFVNGAGQTVNPQYVRNFTFGTAPFERKDSVAQAVTPRVGLIQNFPQTDTTIKLLYGEAFRFVTPQELIRLPAELGNAQSERVNNLEANLLQNLFKGRLGLTFVWFRLRGSTIYAFNAAQQAFGQSPGWSNEGGSVASNWLVDNNWRINASFSSYKLRRASDVSFLEKIDTPPNQALNSPTKLWKAAISRNLFNDMFSLTLEYYYNSAIYLMQSPPTNIVQTLNDDLSFYDIPPLPNETNPKYPGAGGARGSLLTRSRVWKVPPSQYFNLTFSSNVGNDLILVFSVKNIFNQKVFYPLDIDSGSFQAPIMDPHMLRGFGTELFMKVGYRF